jgi:hypothetical protein
MQFFKTKPQLHLTKDPMHQQSLALLTSQVLLSLRALSNCFPQAKKARRRRPRKRRKRPRRSNVKLLLLLPPLKIQPPPATESALALAPPPLPQSPSPNSQGHLVLVVFIAPFLFLPFKRRALALPRARILSCLTAVAFLAATHLRNWNIFVLIVTSCLRTFCLKLTFTSTIAAPSLTREWLWENFE